MTALKFHISSRLAALLCGLFIALAPISTPVNAQGQSAVDIRLSELGAYIPADVEAFLSVRTGSTYLDELDAITLRITERISDDVLPTQTLRDLLDQIIAPEVNGISLVRLVDLWIGDESAIGVRNIAPLLDDNPDNDAEAIVYMAVRIRNRALARGAIATLGLTTEATRTQQGDFAVFTTTNASNQTSVAISDDMLLITLNTATPVLGQPTLADQPDFQQALRELPPQSHLAIFYAQTTETVQDLAQDRAIRDILTALSLNADALGGFAMGFALAEDQSVLVDVVQLRALTNPPRNQPIDLNFAAHIPAGQAFVLHTTDLATLVRSAAGLIAAISASDTPETTYERIEVLSDLLLGLDLQTQILDVADGDFAVIVDLDEAQLLSQADVGAVFALTDSAGADALVNGLGYGATQLFREAVITPTRITDAIPALDAIAIAVPNSAAAEVLVSHDQQLFFAATRPLMAHLVTAVPSLQDDAIYRAAAQYMLPDAHIAVFVNQGGPGALIDLGVALLEPLGVFVAQDTLQPDDIATLRNILTVILNSASISTRTNDNGHLLVRFVLTLAT